MTNLRSTVRNLALMVVVTALYVLVGKWGLRLAFIHASASPVWPATGITLAVFLVFGYRMWPAIFLGAFIVNVTTAGTIATSLGIAAGNTLEGFIGAYLINRFAHGRKVFDRVQDVFKFSFLACLLSTTVSATIGVGSLALGGLARWVDCGSIWLTWWLGDVAGDFVVAPFLILWAENYRLGWKKKQAAEAVFLLLALFLMGRLVFGGFTRSSVENYPVAFVCIPVLIWISFRFTQREAATAVFLLSGIAMAGTLRNFGPFAMYSQNLSLLLLQAFMAIVSVMSITISSAVSENRRTYENLEARVRERTQELSEYIDNMSTLTAKVGLDGKLILVNKIARVVSGMRYQELMDTNFLEGPWWSFDPPVRTRVSRAFQKAVLGRLVNYDEKVRMGTGQIRTINLSLVPVRDSDRNVKYILAEGRDITAQKEAEAALSESEKQTRAIIETARDAFISINEFGIITDWNRQAEASFGWSREEAIGRKLGEIIIPERYRQAHAEGLQTLAGELAPLGGRFRWGLGIIRNQKLR